MLFSCRSKAKGRTARGACPGERLRAGRDAGGGRGARAAGEADCGEGEARDGRAARRRARRGRAPGRGAACPELLRTPGRGAEKLPAAPSCRESPPAARFWPNADRGSARRGAGPVYADLEIGIAAGGRDSGQMPTGVTRGEAPVSRPPTSGPRTPARRRNSGLYEEVAGVKRAVHAGARAWKGRSRLTSLCAFSGKDQVWWETAAAQVK